MQLITISGNIGKDAELRSAGSDQVCSFSLGVKQGWGDKASTNWYRCNLWGKRGVSLQPYLLKGVKAVVAGELTIGEYNGKPQFDVRVSEVEMMSKSEGGQRQPDRGAGSVAGNAGGQSYAAADLDDDVPF